MRRSLNRLLIEFFTIFAVGVGALATFILFFALTPTKLPEPMLNKGREVEAALIAHSAASGFASFKFLERSFGSLWTHYCVLDYTSDDQIVRDYAKQNALRVFVDSSTLLSFVRDEHTNRWSVLLLDPDNKNLRQIPMANDCVTLNGIRGRCAPISASMLRMTPEGKSERCPTGRFTIGLKD